MHKARPSAQRHAGERVENVQQQRLRHLHHSREKVDLRQNGYYDADPHAHDLCDGDIACRLVPKGLGALDFTERFKLLNVPVCPCFLGSAHGVLPAPFRGVFPDTSLLILRAFGRGYGPW